MSRPVVREMKLSVKISLEIPTYNGEMESLSTSTYLLSSSLQKREIGSNMSTYG